MALPARDENQDTAGPCRHASSIVSIRPMSQPSLPMIEARPVEVEGTPPEQRLQPFVIERVAITKAAAAAMPIARYFARISQIISMRVSSTPSTIAGNLTLPMRQVCGLSRTTL
jgi:hypothetical protein